MPGNAVAEPQEIELTRAVSERAAAVRFGQLSPVAVVYAKHCFLDWLGVAIAGSQQPLAGMLREQARMEGVGGVSTLVGVGGITSPYWAALINGAASHALDFDDVVGAMQGHPSVPVLPALLALAEGEGIDGSACIAALVAGVETECGVGRLMARGHYARGFHATGTLGTFGAAAAAAHLLGLDLERWQVALGLAGTQAAGLKCMFGTMAKPLHAGKAAANGLLAARLAAAGFSASPHVLEADQGFVATQSDGCEPADFLARQEAPGITQVLFKYHAACYLTHATIEAIRRLQNEHSLAVDELAAVRVRVPLGHLRVCNIQCPQTGLEGKFSLRFTAALALAGADTGEGAFSDSAVRDPVLCTLRDRVAVEGVPEPPGKYWSEVELTLCNGTVLAAQADVSRPATRAELPRQWQRLSGKFVALAGAVLGEARARELLGLVARLEQLDDIGELLALSRA